MNTFELAFYIGNTRYDLFVDSTQDELKRIVINGKELVNEKFTLNLSRRDSVIYYPIVIGDDELVVSINDEEIVHEYNVYLNNTSLIDGSILNREYEAALAQVKKGFKSFVKDGWPTLLKNNLFSIAATLLVLSAVYYYNAESIIGVLLLVLFGAPLLFGLFIYGEWTHAKNAVKRFNIRFREARHM